MVDQKRKMQKIEKPFFKFEKVGDTLEGTLIDKDVQHFRQSGNDAGKYTLAKDNGEIVQFNGGTILDDYLSDVERGTYIAITRIADVKTASNMTMKNFEIEREV